MVTATAPRPPVAPPNIRRIDLFGFQAGPQGFVLLGTAPNSNLADWEDGLFLRVRAGRGAGKSKGGAYRMINYIRHWPGCFGVITTPLEQTFYDATFPAIKKAFAEAGLREGKEWDYNFNRKTLTFWNNSTVIFISAEHPENLRGPDAAFIWPDEPREMSEAAFLNGVAMLRQPGYPHQAWLTSTPAGKSHWMYRCFEEQDTPSEEDIPFGRYVTMQARTYDNPHGGELNALRMVRNYGGKVRRLTKEEIEALPETQRFRRWYFYDLSPMARQELNGEEVAIEGLVYDCWDAQRHVVPVEKWPTQPEDMVRVYAGGDFGWRNPCAELVEGMDDQGRFYIMKSFRKNHMAPQTFTGVVLDIQEKHKVQMLFADDTSGWIPAMRYEAQAQHKTLLIRKAKKSVGSRYDPSSGIGACYLALSRVDSEGNQMFFVDPACKEFIDDIENYRDEIAREDKPKPERPKELHDDVMACWRYVQPFLNRLSAAKDAYTFRIESSPVRL